MRFILSRRLLGLATVALALGLGGCGKPKVDVTGKVTYNGAPLAKPDGQIVFVNAEGVSVEAAIGEDGSYKAANVVSGPNRVVVVYKNPAFKPAARPRGAPTAQDRPTLISPFLIPEKYTSPDTSELSVDVKHGTVFNVEMTGPKIP